MNTEEKIVAFQQLGEISQGGVFVFDLLTLEFQYFNEKFPQLLDTTTEILQAAPASVVANVRPEDLRYLKTLLNAVKEKPHLSDIEFRLAGNGHVRYRSLDAYYFEAENLIAGFLKDISAQKERDEYMINYGAKKNTLLETLAHNLSGPLKLSQRVIDTGDQRSGKAAISVDDQLAFVRKVNEQCIDTIHEFLKEEHFLSERVYVKRNRFDVIEKITNVIDQFRVSHGGRRITLFSPDQLFVVSDEVRVMQILNNLLSNAVKFTPVDSVIELRVEELPSSFQLTVKDEGIGIPLHLQPFIFERHSPAGRTGLNGEKSIGVGLSITKNLVELLNGTIDFVSDENKGATFFVTLAK